MCQISSLMAATVGPVAEFSSFANFEERKRKSIHLMSFPKIVHQKGSFGQIRKNPLFRFCRPILDIFGLTLLNSLIFLSRTWFQLRMSRTLLSLDVTSHEQTMICRQLFAGHVVGSRPMERKEKMHRMIMSYNGINTFKYF